MKKLVLLLLLFAPGGLMASTELEDLSLNGMAVFSELKRPVYLAALYVENPQSGAKAILFSNELKAMEVVVTAKRWSSRRFSEQWTRALLVNNELNDLQRYDTEVIQFTGLLKGSLKQGDKVIILRDKKSRTIVTINGTEVLRLKSPGFYELVLRTWIGPRPPSTVFKDGLLSQQADSQLMDLYATLEPSPERIEEVAAWTGEVQEQKKSKAVAVIPAAVVTTAVVATVAVEPSAAASTAGAAVNTAPVMASTDAGLAMPALVETDIAAPEVAKSAEQEKAEAAEQAVAAKIAAIAESQPEEVTVVDESGFLQEEQNKLLRLYQHMVVKGILAKVVYPSAAVRRNLEGTAMMELTVNRNGEIVSVEFLEKTRHKRLNRAAEKAVADVGQFPAVPEALEGDEVRVKLPVKFILS